MPASTRQSRSGALLCAALGALAAPAVQALDATATVDYTGEYTTNTARTETDEVEEWIHTPAFNIALNQEGAQLEMDAGYRLERRYHEEDLFDTESAATGNASVVWHALPERLDLTVRNTRTESTRRSIDANTEANRQTVSYTEAGPTLRFTPRRNSELQLEYLYTDVSAEETETDSERQTGTLRYIVGLSAVRSVTFTGSYNAVDFDNPLAPDLDVSIATVTFSQTEGDLAYDLTAGYNRTERDQDRDTVDGPIFEAGMTWNFTTQTVIALEAARQITDRSSNLMSGRLDFGEGQVSEDTDLNEVFTETRGSVSLSRPFGNNEITLSATASEEDYEDALRDSERYSVGVSLNRALNRRTNLSLDFEAGRREFTDEAEEQDEYRGALRISRELTRRFSLSLGVRYDERESDTEGGVGSGRSYEEWTGVITLGYRLLGQP